MKVLTVFAHPNSKSFYHAVLRQFTVEILPGHDRCGQ
jgi:putative NADPH-quinone reductase